jgi:2'-5' RNA ligase
MDLRCFIAIELPGELRDAIDEGTSGLRNTGSDVRWVRKENLHITIKFLGGTPEELLPAIKKRLQEVLEAHRPFEVRFSSVGVFPNPKYPRVVWIGMEDSGELKRLKKDVEDAMTGFGYEAEARDFTPHLTIGRVRSQRGGGDLIKGLAPLKDAIFGRITVGEISIMKSDLKKTGAEYSRLEAVTLR